MSDCGGSSNTDAYVNGSKEPCRLKQHCLAKALYDNTSESPDELSFSRGDVVTVLEQNPGGLEGWWLCSLRGRQGIAPGNRMRLIPGVFDSTGLGYTISDVSGSNNLGNLSPSLPSTPSIINGSRRRSWHNNSNRVVTPQKIGDVYLYDVPLGSGVTYDVPVSRQLRSSNSSPLPNQVFQFTSQSKSANCAYDTPQSPKIVKSSDHALTRLINDEKRCSDSSNDDISKLEAVEAYDVPLSARRVTLRDDQNDCLNYDVPPPPTKLVENELVVEICYDVPRSNRSSGIISHVSSNSSLFSPSPQSNCSSLVASTSFSSLGDSNRSSFEKPASEVYDVPPSGNPRRVHLCTDISYHDAKSNFSPVAKTSNVRGTILSNDYLNFSDDEEEVNSKNLAVYDMPKSVSKSCEQNQEMHLTQRFSTCSIESKDSATYSTLSTDSVKELNIDLNDGILLVVKYQQKVLGAINDLFALIVDSNWRQKEKLSDTVGVLRNTCHALSNSMKELVDFANGVYINSTNASDKVLSQKMSKLLLQLVNSNAIIQSSVTSVNLKGWTADRLASPGAATSALNCKTPDELDQLVACSRGLTEDIKHITSFIRGNAKLLFKDSVKNVCEKPAILPKPTHLRTLPSIPPPAPPRNSNMQSRPLPPLPKEKELINIGKLRDKSPELIISNDYEYVSLESKDSKNHKVSENVHNKEPLDKVMEESRNVAIYSMPQKNNANLEVSTYGRLCDATSLPTVESLPAKQLPSGDKQVLLFYCAQLESHKCILGHSIDTFIASIDDNQPPKVFIERSKLVVVSALKLIYIADSIARNVNSELSIALSKCCNCLCDYLKTLVVNTKKAALQFPSVTAVQEMVDCVVDVSHSANKLFTSLFKMSNL